MRPSRRSSISSWRVIRRSRSRSATVATPASFADENYFGIDAFVFVDKAGKKQAVRYQMLPEKLVHLSTEEAAKKSPDFLVDELPKRVAAKPVVFHLKAQLAAARRSDQGPEPTVARRRARSSTSAC